MLPRTQRALLQELNHRADIDEELIGKHLAVLDPEEYKLREKQRSAVSK